jgi:hypothetical protein
MRHRMVGIGELSGSNSSSPEAAGMNLHYVPYMRCSREPGAGCVWLSSSDRRGRSRRGKRDPKTLQRESRKGYAGNQPRHVVADAPNGYFSGSLGKRVSKPTLSSSNDRSSAMCRFESCRPHHGSLAQRRAAGLTGTDEGSIPSRSIQFSR